VARLDLQTRLQGSPVIDIGNDSDQIDTFSLCWAKHSVYIYATDEDGSGVPNAVDDSIIVGFNGLDSSGAGCLDQFIEGGILFITDPEAWRDTVSEGMAILQERYGDCVSEETGLGNLNCWNELLAAGTYAGMYGVTNTAAYIGQGVGSAYTYTTQGLGGALADVYSPTYGEGAGGGFAKWYKEGVDSIFGWGAEESPHHYTPFRADEVNPFQTQSFAQESGDAGYSTTGEGSCFSDTWGMVLHNQSGSSHKIRITITRTDNGVTSTEYNTELAGGTDFEQIGDKIYFQPHYKKFKLTGPGLWTIRCESLAAFMDCGTPDLDYTATVEVAEAPQTDADGNPITAQTSDLSPIIDLAGGSMRPIYTIAALIGIGTVGMYFGFNWLLGKRKKSKKKKASNEEE